MTIVIIIVGMLGLINGIWNCIELYRNEFDYSDWSIASDNITIIFLSLMVICSAFLI